MLSVCCVKQKGLPLPWGPAPVRASYRLRFVCFYLPLCAQMKSGHLLGFFIITEWNELPGTKWKEDPQPFLLNPRCLVVSPQVSVSAPEDRKWLWRTESYIHTPPEAMLLTLNTTHMTTACFTSYAFTLLSHCMNGFVFMIMFKNVF